MKGFWSRYPPPTAATAATIATTATRPDLLELWGDRAAESS